MTYALKDLRQELKAIGYKVKIKTYSEFKSGTIVSNDGEPISGYFTPEELIEHQKKHNPAILVRDKFKGKVWDGEFRIVLE